MNFQVVYNYASISSQTPRDAGFETALDMRDEDPEFIGLLNWLLLCTGA